MKDKWKFKGKCIDSNEIVEGSLLDLSPQGQYIVVYNKETSETIYHPVRSDSVSEIRVKYKKQPTNVNETDLINKDEEIREDFEKEYFVGDFCEYRNCEYVYKNNSVSAEKILHDTNNDLKTFTSGYKAHEEKSKAEIEELKDGYLSYRSAYCKAEKSRVELEKDDTISFVQFTEQSISIKDLKERLSLSEAQLKLSQESLGSSDNKKIEELEQQLELMKDELNPSAYTKRKHIGEYKFDKEVSEYDEDGDMVENCIECTVPWTTVKEIMKAMQLEIKE